MEWLQKTGGFSSNGLTDQEEEELVQLRREVRDLRDKLNLEEENKEEMREESDDERDSVLEHKDLVAAKNKMKQNKRSGVSSEVYGKYNKKNVFVPRVIKKSKEQEQIIKVGIIRSFLFRNLDSYELNIVVKAMEEKRFK